MCIVYNGNLVVKSYLLIPERLYGVFAGWYSFWMRNNGKKHIGISFNEIIEAPASIDARLKDTAHLINLLSLQGFMPWVTNEESELLLKALLDARWSFVKLPSESVSSSKVHAHVLKRRGRERVSM